MTLHIDYTRYQRKYHFLESKNNLWHIILLRYWSIADTPADCPRGMSHPYEHLLSEATPLSKNPPPFAWYENGNWVRQREPRTSQIKHSRESSRLELLLAVPWKPPKHTRPLSRSSKIFSIFKIIN